MKVYINKFTYIFYYIDKTIYAYIYFDQIWTFEENYPREFTF